jgi:hypothetical protein
LRRHDGTLSVRYGGQVKRLMASFRYVCSGFEIFLRNFPVAELGREGEWL